MAADVTRQHARVMIVTAAGRKADHNANRLALVEARHILRGSRAGKECENRKREQEFHGDLRRPACNALRPGAPQEQASALTHGRVSTPASAPALRAR